MKICNNCKYWAKDTEGNPAWGLGECIRFPPKIFGDLKENQGGLTRIQLITHMTAFPATFYSQTCGEWKHDANSTHD